MKKIVSTMLALSILSCSSVLAAEVKPTDTSSNINSEIVTTLPAQNVIQSLCKDAKITEVGESQLTIETLDKDTIILNCSINTVFIDSETGKTIRYSDFKVGDSIRAYHSTIMTRSLPGQTPAIAVIRQTGEKNNCHFMTVSDIERTSKDEIRVLDENKSVFVTLPTQMSVLNSDEKVSSANVNVGDSIVVWYEVVALSMPAQATTDKVVKVDSVVDVKESINISNEGVITINDKVVTGTIKTFNDMKYIPLRSVAEALGYTVKWNGADKPITVDKDYLHAEITSKSIKYNSNGFIFNLGVAESVDGSNYVPINFFVNCLGVTVVEEGKADTANDKKVNPLTQEDVNVKPAEKLNDSVKVVEKNK